MHMHLSAAPFILILLLPPLQNYIAALGYISWYRELKAKTPMGRNVPSTDLLKLNCQFLSDDLTS